MGDPAYGFSLTGGMGDIHASVGQNGKVPSLPSICDHFSLSRTYLCRIFKEATGDSPIDYWIGLKIKEAKKLIREGDQNITQISEHLGYSSIHHFTRMFKRHTGLSPSAYKTSVKL